MKKEKILGYILMAVGIILIIFTLYSMIQVFTGASPPPELFHFSDISFPAREVGQPSITISGEELNTFFDLIMWFILMWFIMWSGGKIASLGVNLIREIKVEMKKSRKEMAGEGEEEEREARTKNEI